MKYRAEIDGLRALAVVPVILFHAGFELFSGGYIGVDVFFVISGYLITTILIDDIENDRFSIINFYERRARRILPALFFVMLCCIPFAWMWMLPNQLKDFSQSFVAVTLFASNVLFWFESDYFDAAAEEKPLLHTWSLAVEEQYYLLFPIFLFLLWRFGKDRTFWAIVVVAVVSFALSEWGSKREPEANFYLAPFRAWELFAGSITAFIVQKKGVRANNLLSLLGLAAILYPIFVYHEATPFPGIYALAPVAGVALIILFADQRTVAGKILNMRVFVGIGLISYSAYLWHQPLFAFARIRSIELPQSSVMGLLAVVSLLLAIISYRYVEQPFRNKNAYSRQQIFATSFTFALACVLLGAVGFANGGFSHRFNQETFADWEDTSHCTRQGVRSTDQLSDLTTTCFTPAREKKFILIGDSHAETVSKSLRSVIEANNGALITLIDKGCLPVPGTSRQPTQRNCIFAKNLFWELANQTDAKVILAARWRLYLDGQRFDNGEGGVEYGDSWANHVIHDASQDVYRHVYTELVNLASANEILVLSQIPEAGWKVPEVAAKIRKFEGTNSVNISTSYSVYLQKNKRVNQLLDALATHNAISVLRTENIVCDKSTQRCSNTVNGRSLYRDDNHPSPQYSDLIARKFEGTYLKPDKSVSSL